MLNNILEAALRHTLESQHTEAAGCSEGGVHLLKREAWNGDFEGGGFKREGGPKLGGTER